MRFKIEYVFALLILLVMGAMACAEEAPPACVGDQCSEAAAPVAEKTIVVSRTRYVLAGRGFPLVRYGLKGGARLVLLPFRAAREIHNNSLARRAARGNQLAAARLSAKACRGAY